MSDPTLGDLVDVADVDTVVRLDGPGNRLGELVLTGDVTESLAAVLEAAGSAGGAGFFVVGPFGSGKSHFLAAVGELLAEPRAVEQLPGWDPTLRRLAKQARPSLPVPVPLVEYRAHAALEDVVAERAWRAIGASPPTTGADRIAAWDRVLEAATATGKPGLLLLLDELSEFLRAKAGPALTEDLRFLQFLGEWGRDRHVLVVAALQESIEEVANVSQRELTRIRDRYRPSLTLSMRHVEDLVRGRLVRLRHDATTWVDRAWEEIAAAFPATPLSRERFTRCYPLHPDTLGVLEGLRFVLSQQRGVVDFICRRLQDCLARPYSALITPDEVFDHFRTRFHERTETTRFADTVVPYFERMAPELVDPSDEELARRAVKLLSLLAASPLERPRTAAELGFMLLTRVSDLDPAANVAYLERAILEPLVERGAYVVAKPDPASPRRETTYTVELDADAAVVARIRVAQARADLSPGDRRLIATLVEAGSSPSLPLQLATEVGLARRELLWHNTLRAVVVGTTRVLELTPDDARRMVAQARAAGAEGCILIAEVELEESVAARERAAVLAEGAERLAVWVPDSIPNAERDALVDIHARRLVADAAEAEGRADLVEVLARSADADTAVAREMLRRVYFEGTVAYPSTAVGTPDLPSLAGLPFERQLVALANPLLSGLHPRHQEVMPRRELVGERQVRQLVTEVLTAGRLGPAALARGQLRALIDAYLVPLGLARVRKDGATVSPDAARSPAVAETLRLVGDGEPVPATDVVQALAEGPVGLTESEAILVLNACVGAGMVEAWRGRQRLTEPFVAVGQSDRVGPGELVEPSVRAAVEALSPITGPGPFDPWTSNTQRAAWEYAKAWLDGRREDLAQVRTSLARFEEVPALGSADPGPVLDDLSAVGGVVEGLAPAPKVSPPGGLRQLVAAIPEGDAVLGAARRLGAVARFVRDELRRVEEAAAYLTHPELTIPPADEVLQARRDAAAALVRDALPLAANDRIGELFGANREFRSSYLAAYQDGHDRYHGAVTPAEVEKITTTPAYQALARLAAVGAIAVPDDRIKVDRLLAAAAPQPCRRRVAVELGWKPRCSCGFALGDTEPSLDAEAVLAVAERGVGQYLDELTQPDVLARLEDAAVDLVALGRHELAEDLRRVVTLTQRGSAPATDDDLGGLASLLSGDVSGVLRDVLGGSQLIVTRDLARLRDDLIGRRYPKRKLAEIVAAWIDPDGDIPPQSFVEIVDSADDTTSVRHPAAPRAAPPPSRTGSATVAFLAERFPSLASLLPSEQAADAFWLAAWWRDRPAPPSWLPTRLLADPDRMARAADAARGDLLALGELADLDRRVSGDTLLGDHVATILDLPTLPAAEVARLLRDECLLRFPVRLAVDQLLRRLAGDWQLVSLLDDLEGLTSRHALLTNAELAPALHLVDAARHLAALERNLDGASARTLVEDLYPAHYAPVPELISRASVAAASPVGDGEPIVSTELVDAFRASAARLLASADAAGREHAAHDFAGCLRVWEVGESIVAPLLRTHKRVAVLLVDALRADLARRVNTMMGDVLDGRPMEQRWAVVPAPTRTAEAVAALRLGRPVPAGSEQLPSTDEDGVPFAHLGYDAEALVGADRDHRSAELVALWESGPPISVAVATGIDERLHRTSVELAGLSDEVVAALGRRVIPSLGAIPESVPLVVLADHGFRENPSWGHGPEGRYVHGGTSLEECVIPVVTFGVRSAHPADR